MRVFKNKAFMRFAKKAGISDAALCDAIRDAERGLTAAVLGGGFVHGFAKSERDNIEKDELVALKRLASELLAYDEKTIARVIASGTLVEVTCDEKAIP